MLPTPFADILIALRFFSCLPLPATRREIALGSQGLAQAVMMVPVAGAVIGLIPALVLAAAGAIGLPSSIAAPLAVAALVMVTGALHEDGLADCADGFGGGRTRERKLEIMRDSRIGTYGGCAIGLSLYLRAASLAVIAEHGVLLAAAALVASAAVSRTLCLLPLALLPAARTDGAGAAAGGLERGRYAVAIGISGVAALAPCLAGASVARAVFVLIAAALAALAVCAVARQQVGGQTGDVAGAAQQMAEVVSLVSFASGA
ncbi:adenosylcobinamide-GDP ribazoletransferase [Beijerinckia sp. L45]|uniref:adenosylcobinamide-GDP ribazoletransferase n=1 Tax=Beijerinckia sp. L45 TaxID=1641855 RepID=UPI001FF040B2|nr:adenosylcobinamide-GDP ribazoletransferase [Beijerinckia sp. L45]